MDPDGQIRATDSARPERDGGAPGQLSMSLGHERGGTLVPGGDDPDAGVLEDVEQPEERLSGHREGVPDARGAESVGDEPAHRPRSGLRGDLGFGFLDGLGWRDGLRSVRGDIGCRFIRRRFDWRRFDWRRFDWRGFVGRGGLELGHGDCAPRSGGPHQGVCQR